MRAPLRHLAARGGGSGATWSTEGRDTGPVVFPDAGVRDFSSLPTNTNVPSGGTRDLVVRGEQVTFDPVSRPSINATNATDSRRGGRADGYRRCDRSFHHRPDAGGVDARLAEMRPLGTMMAANEKTTNRRKSVFPLVVFPLQLVCRTTYGRCCLRFRSLAYRASPQAGRCLW